MKIHNGGLGNFLNEVTQVAEKGDAASQIVYVDIDDIEANPQNFYGLRDIDTLAGLIAVSHLIEPLIVRKKSDGKYLLISGHRRRAAVQKLLDDGNYTERKLPCMIKAREKISIEQENGETVEFDEDAVDMLNLIASNRGQREERTTDEKLQEIKHLEAFARAIYNQKNWGSRGRFRTFFAEQILNISKSQLQRIISMENLTANVKRAIDEKKISETAATEMASMPAEEQDACLDRILSGELKGRVQDVQKCKSANKVRDPTTSAMPLVLAQVSRESVKILDVPEQFDDPQKEAEEWFYQERLGFYEMIYTEAKRLSEEESDELKAAQWGIRASVARYNIEELRVSHGVK